MAEIINKNKLASMQIKINNLHSGGAACCGALAGWMAAACVTTGGCVMAASAARFCTDTGAKRPPS